MYRGVFLVSKHRKWRYFEQLNIGNLKVFITLRRFQRFWLFSKCHCKSTHIDMDIPKTPACRGISLASDYNFRISDLKNCVDKTSSGSKSLFSSFERFCLPATISTILVILNRHCKNMHAGMSIPKIPACRGISLASNCTFWIYEFKNVVDKITSGSMPLFSFYF